MNERRFRFGLQLRPEPADPMVAIAQAQRAEAAGFDLVLMPDHVGADMVSPMLLLSAVAQATDTIRLGTFVLNNEMRNPVQLAWEAATLDRISGGRFELGLGAGHTPAEFAATGIAKVAAAVRKRRLAESVEIIRRLLDGETVTVDGDHYGLDSAAVPAPAQARLPILVGGNGDALLTHAGRHADIIGFQGLGRTLDDGHRHQVNWSPQWLDHQIATVRAGAGDRFPAVELNALVQIVDITDDRAGALDTLAERLEGNTIDDLDSTPYLAIGTHAEIAEHLERVRARWGVSYFVVRELDAFAPVIALLRP